MLFFINIKTRKVHIAGLTPCLGQEWVNEQTQSLLPILNNGKKVKKVLIRDRDTKYSRKFDEVFEKEGFTVQKTPFMSPNMNSYAESWVGTIKRECLNRFVVFGERHLRYLISEYVQYYNSTQPHSSMGNQPLEYTPEKATGKIKCQTTPGGIMEPTRAISLRGSLGGMPKRPKLIRDLKGRGFLAAGYKALLSGVKP